MRKVILYLILLTSSPIFCAAALQHPDSQLCSTSDNPALQSSYEYRNLCFKSLAALGYPKPQEITIINCTQFGVAKTSWENIFKDQNGITIELNQSYWDKQPYGVIRFTLLHEAYHVLEIYNQAKQVKNQVYHGKSNPHLFYQTQQKIEKAADRAAAQHINCEICLREMIQFLLDESRQKYKKTTFNLNDFDHTSDNDLLYGAFAQEFKKIKIESKKRNHQHPLDIERALQIYIYTRIDGYSRGKVCDYHQKKQNFTYKAFSVGGQPYLAETAWEQKEMAEKNGWKFDLKNKFQFDEIVLIYRNANRFNLDRYTYGQIMGKNGQNYIVRVDINKTKILPPQEIGKKEN